MQYCLEPLIQHCMGFSTVQCCSETIKTTLNRIFSCAMLYVAFQTTLRRVLTYARVLSYAMLS